MPLYPYRCTQCGHQFEKIQSFSAEPEKVCPKCQGELTRLLTAPRFNFKGEGWYVNDYASKSNPASSGDSSTSSAASVPASTPAPAAAPTAAAATSGSES